MGRRMGDLGLRGNRATGMWQGEEMGGHTELLAWGRGCYRVLEIKGDGKVTHKELVGWNGRMQGAPRVCSVLVCDCPVIIFKVCTLFVNRYQSCLYCYTVTSELLVCLTNGQTKT